MGCEFKIKSDILKNAIKLNSSLLPQFDEDSITLFTVKGDKCRVQAGSKGRWVNQILPVTSSKNGKFAIKAGRLLQVKYPQKEISLTVSDTFISVESGSFHVEFEIGDVDIEKMDTSGNTNLDSNHKFEQKSFSNALKYLTFVPIMKDKDTRLLIHIYAKDGNITYISHDSFRGGVFEDKTEIKDLDVIVDLTELSSMMSSLSNDNVLFFGEDQKQVKVRGKSLDFQFPFQTGVVNDVKTLIEESLKTSVASFCVSAEVFRNALNTVSSISKDSELKIDLSLTKKKSMPDKLTLKAKSGTSKADFSLDVSDLTSDVEFSTTDKIMRDVIGFDGILKISLCQSNVVVESLNHNLKYVVPRLEDK